MAIFTRFSFFIFCVLINIARSEDVLKNEVELPDAIITSSQFITEFYDNLSIYITSSLPFLETVFYEETLSNETGPQNDKNNETNETIPLTNSAPYRKNIINCAPYDYIGSPKVEIVDETTLIEILTPTIGGSRSTPSTCIVLIFYGQSCPFSAMAAPHFNSLPRAFPSLRIIALYPDMFQSILPMFGVVSVPSVVLFHNSRPIAKFGHREYTLAEFSKFITRYTGIQGNQKMYVASYDFGGPLKSVPSDDTDYLLLLSWLVIIIFVLLKIYSLLF